MRPDGLEWWLVGVFGWPGPILAAVCSMLGLIWSSATMLVTAGVLLVPFSLYLGFNPGSRWGFLLPVLPLASAWAIRRGAAALAWFPVAGLVAILLWLARLVVHSNQ